MNISFADVSIAKPGALALVVAEGATLDGAGADLDRKSGGAIKRAMKAANFTGKAGSILEIMAPHDVAASRILLIGTGKAGEATAGSFENAGGELVGRLGGEDEEVVLADEGAEVAVGHVDFEFVQGVQVGEGGGVLFPLVGLALFLAVGA